MNMEIRSEIGDLVSCLFWSEHGTIHRWSVALWYNHPTYSRFKAYDLKVMLRRMVTSVPANQEPCTLNPHAVEPYPGTYDQEGYFIPYEQATAPVSGQESAGLHPAPGDGKAVPDLSVRA